MAAGAISAMYIGDKFEAMPMAMPPTIRHHTNAENVCASPVASDDTTNNNAEKISSRLRPKRSLNAPATSEPTRQPASAQPLAQPVSEAEVRLKYFS